MQRQGDVGRDDVLWRLGSLCGLFRIPFDASLIAQDFPPPYSLAILHEAARALGIKTGDCLLAKPDWQKLPFPAMAFRRPASPVTVESSQAGQAPAFLA